MSYKPTSALTPEQLQTRRERERTKKRTQRVSSDQAAFENALKVLLRTAETYPTLKNTLIESAKVLLTGFSPVPHVKPAFPWAGGKTWLKADLNRRFEQSIRDDSRIYCEPFCGGLGAFLNVADTLRLKGIRKVILNDFNPLLTNFYLMVKDHSDLLVDSTIKLEEQFKAQIPHALLGLQLVDKIEKSANHNLMRFFADVRERLNKREGDSIERARDFFFLMHHCVNGIYRENKNGTINSAFNWKLSPLKDQVIERRIKELYVVFQYFDVRITNNSWRELDFLQDTFYYLDPPYLKSKEAKSGELQYSSAGFSIEDQRELLKAVQKCGGAFLYSNHELEVLHKMLENPSVHTETVSRKNTVSHRAEDRSKGIEEMLVGRNSAWPFDKDGKWLNSVLKRKLTL